MCAPLMHSLEKNLSIYAGINASSISENYTWKFDQKILATRFHLSTDGENWCEKTRALKRGLARTWTLHPERRMDVADYAVRVWGGVKRNAAVTLQRYVEIISDGKLPENHKGIASWSKVAAFSNPDLYAIFDARVSFSLNAIQVIYGGEDFFWFPQLPGRNNLLNASWPFLKSIAVKNSWHVVESPEVYSVYINLLRAVSVKIGIDLEEVEMLLFSNAEKLAREMAAISNCR